MNRRAFLGSAAAAFPGSAPAQHPRPSGNSETPVPRLAGLGQTALRERLRRELFQVLLPFWDAHGVDHQYGGVTPSAH